MEPITPEEFERKLQEIEETLSYDPEGKHSDMDDIIIETLENLGYEAGCKIFKEAKKY